jgi:hypothetical protein
MVSNRLGMERRGLLDVLELIRREHRSDPAYQELRGMFPPDWPL